MGGWVADVRRAASLQPARNGILRTSCFLVTLMAAVASAAEKPKVPPGIDPGGVLVALIGEGVDYTKPEIAQRLARDGEGEIIAWDFVDGDRRPYSSIGSAQNAAVMAAINEPGTARIVVVRCHAGPPPPIQRFAEGITMAAAANARIIALSATDDPEFAVLIGSASARFREVVFILSGWPAKVPYPNLENVIRIKNSNDACIAQDIALETRAEADIAARGECSVAPSDRGALDETAAARIAALAARILVSEPGLDGAGLKARIIALAKPFPDGMPKVAIYGWIEDPSAHYAGK